MEINYKLTQAKKQLDKIEELKTHMDFLEGGMIRELKDYLRNYVDSPEEESNKNMVEQELLKVLEIAEINKKAQQQSQQ